MKEYFRYQLQLIVIIAIISSCASTVKRVDTGLAVPRLDSFRPSISSNKDMVLTGKMRIALPEARLRGLVKIRYSGRGKMRIDFRHSNIFGAYEEDISLLVDDPEILIFDRKRNAFYSGDSSLSMIARESGMNIDARDIPMVLLLLLPSRDELKGLKYIEKRGGAWKLTGSYRGRELELRGERANEPNFMRQCSARSCYNIEYEGYEDRGGFGYPSYIRLESDSRAVVISIEIAGVRIVKEEPGIFRREAIFRHF